MEGKGTISDYRKKMDKTLASPNLTDHEKLQILVRNQILKSSNSQFEEYLENVVERRSNEVSNFLGMLRSTASVDDVEKSKSSDESSGGWKVKQDTEEYRVMYKEGPEGTPFHTLLVEGYVDAPLDVCLCISWESSLYNKWWPQTAIPTFKIISSRVLQRVGASEQISLVRMKVSWPVSSREAVIHYFAFEYFKDDLMVVLLNSISDSETIDRRVHGFTKDGIPDAEEVVRIDVVGGFALQKVTENRSYFRTIANMDIKLDFVPPSFINFVSRQLVGSGFKLYKKEVASVSKGDQKFCEALNDTLYARIRKALDNVEEISVVDSEAEDVKFRERNELKNSEEIKGNDIDGSEALDDCALKSSNGTTNHNMPSKEVFASCSDEEESPRSEETTEISRNEQKVPISPKVERALETLENLISIFQEHKSNLGKKTAEDLMPSVINQISRNCAESSETESIETRSTIKSEKLASRQKASNSNKRETNHSKISPASPIEGQTAPSNSKSSASQPSMDRKTASIVGKSDVESAHAETAGEKGLNERKKKKSRFCCMHFLNQY